MSRDLALTVAIVAVPDFLGSLFHVPVAMAYGAWNEFSCLRRIRRTHSPLPRIRQ